MPGLEIQQTCPAVPRPAERVKHSADPGALARRGAGAQNSPGWLHWCQREMVARSVLLPDIWKVLWASSEKL